MTAPATPAVTPARHLRIVPQYRAVRRDHERSWPRPHVETGSPSPHLLLEHLTPRRCHGEPGAMLALVADRSTDPGCTRPKLDGCGSSPASTAAT